MDVYQYRDILERVNTAKDQFPEDGTIVALLEAILEQNEMIGEIVERTKSIQKELYYIQLAVEEIADE